MCGVFVWCDLVCGVFFPSLSTLEFFILFCRTFLSFLLVLVAADADPCAVMCKVLLVVVVGGVAGC